MKLRISQSVALPVEAITQTIAILAKNFKNLELLCANCHRRHTWGQMKYGVHRGETLFPLLVAEVAKRCVSTVGSLVAKA